MEQEDTAISPRQIGLGVDLWSTVHIIRNHNEGGFDGCEYDPEEIEEMLGIDIRAQNKILERLRKRLTL